MNNNLLTALIDKDAFVEDTIITANYQSMDLFGRSFSKIGDFKVKNIIKGAEQLIFELITMRDGSTIIRTGADSIKAVDGMDVIRYADIYDLLPDGTSKKVGRKRGRKPKDEL